MEGGHNQDAARSNAGRRRLTVPDAAEALGISIEAVRGRIKRGTIPHEREGDRVYVLLDADQSRPGRDQDAARSGDQGELVVELRDRVAYLERQVEEEREARRRADTLLARLMDRVPELEAAPAADASPAPPESRQEDAQEPAEEPTRAAPAPGGTEPPAASERVPWYRRWFG